MRVDFKRITLREHSSMLGKILRQHSTRTRIIILSNFPFREYADANQIFMIHVYMSAWVLFTEWCGTHLC